MVAWRDEDCLILQKEDGEAVPGPGVRRLSPAARGLFPGGLWSKKPLLTALAARRVHLELIPVDAARFALDAPDNEAFWLLDLRPEPAKIRFLENLGWEKLYYDDIALIDDVLRERTLPPCFDHPRIQIDQAIALSRWENVEHLDLFSALRQRPMTEEDWEIILAGRRLDGLVRRHPFARLTEYRDCLNWMKEREDLYQLGRHLQSNPGSDSLFAPVALPAWVEHARQIRSPEEVRAILDQAENLGDKALSRCALGRQCLVETRLAERSVYFWIKLEGPAADTTEIDLAIIRAEPGDHGHPLMRAVWAELEERLPNEQHPRDLAIVRPGKQRRRGRQPGEGFE